MCKGGGGGYWLYHPTLLSTPPSSQARQAPIWSARVASHHTDSSSHLLFCSSSYMPPPPHTHILPLPYSCPYPLQVGQLLHLPTLRQETRRLAALAARKLKRPVGELQRGLLDSHNTDERLNALLRWAQMVASLNGLSCHNFTSSFGDGRVLCAMVGAGTPREQCLLYAGCAVT